MRRHLSQMRRLKRLRHLKRLVQIRGIRQTNENLTSPVKCVGTTHLTGVLTVLRPRHNGLETVTRRDFPVFKSG